MLGFYSTNLKPGDPELLHVSNSNNPKITKQTKQEKPLKKNPELRGRKMESLRLKAGPIMLFVVFPFLVC